DLDRRQLFGRRGLLRVRGGISQGKQGDEETRRQRKIAPPCGCGDGRHGSNLGMTSVARHSEPSLTLVLISSSGEANACTPRPTSSRVTTADGRSPGLRVVTFRRLPRTEIPSGVWRRIRRIQLRGQPRHWGFRPAPHSLLIPKMGTVTNI